jgi:RimJ/RimL family protein N-acetyltransferase
MHIVFETPRLILRQFTEDDAPLILQLNSDPEIVKYVHEPVLTTEEQAKKLLSILFYLNTKKIWDGGQRI